MMVSWLDTKAGAPDPEQGEYQFLEFFAGRARLTQMAHAVGYSAAAYDIDYGRSLAARGPVGKRSCMDLNSSAGLVPLVSRFNMSNICFM